MTNTSEKTARTSRLTGDVPKPRQCLRCEVTFDSEWFGERICSNCKKSNAWRNGTAYRPALSSNKR